MFLSERVHLLLQLHDSLLRILHIFGVQLDQVALGLQIPIESGYVSTRQVTGASLVHSEWQVTSEYIVTDRSVPLSAASSPKSDFISISHVSTSDDLSWRLAWSCRTVLSSLETTSLADFLLSVSCLHVELTSTKFARSELSDTSLLCNTLWRFTTWSCRWEEVSLDGRHAHEQEYNEYTDLFL